MFWIVLVLSGLVVVGFALVGVRNEHLTIAGKELGLPVMFAPAEFYRMLFVGLGIGYWLSLVATALAIISTASIFPDFVSGGSVDLYLCKPISRLRLFVTKYLAGLLFVALQVLVFSVASLLVLGLRGGTWEPRVLLAVPIVVCFFSYLYCVSVLVGVVTRSTIAAILLTVLAWGLMFLVSSAEIGLLLFKDAVERDVRSSQTQLKVINAQIAYDDKQPPDARRPPDDMRQLRNQQAELQAVVDGKGAHNLGIAHSIVYGVKTALPKTSETVGLLNRWLLSPETMEKGEARDESDTAAARAPATRNGKRRIGRRNEHGPNADDAVELQRELNDRPVWWIVGTSLGFECAVLSLAAWVFCRRDY
jgi:hypothetical protein